MTEAATEPPATEPPAKGLPGPEPLTGHTERPDGEPAGGEAPSRTTRIESAQLYALAGVVAPALIVLVVAAMCIMNHLHGVDWGDDFALYLRQAKALNIGNIGEVIRDNRFTVDNSGWHTFSPYLYPWGWPLMVAPVYALFGLNYEALKVLEVAALCGFLCFYYGLVRRRAGALPAAVLMLVIGLSLSYVGATNTVLSDLPYLFVVGLCLWWIDRCRREGILRASRRDLVVLGLLLALAFNVRREGSTLLFVVAALQGFAVVPTVWRARSLRQVDWRHAVVPYATFAGAVVGFQLLLPSTLIPTVPGAGLRNASSNIHFYRDILAEQVGLKIPGYHASLFHSHPLAERLLVITVVLAVVGLVLRLATTAAEDVPLAAYLVGASLVMLVSPYQEGRYLFTITPFLLYFAYQALPSLVRFVNLPGRGVARLAAAIPILALAGMVSMNFLATKHSTDFHNLARPTIDGPESPAAVEMVAAVDRLTRGDDVILFFRARAMTLLTDRVALQGSNLDQMLPRVDWYVMERGSTYSQALLTDDQAAARGLTKAWDNANWVIWRVPPRAP